MVATGRKEMHWVVAQGDFLGRKGPLSALEQGLHRCADLSRVTEYIPALCGFCCLQVLIEYKHFTLKNYIKKSDLSEGPLLCPKRIVQTYVDLSPLTVALFFESVSI